MSYCHFTMSERRRPIYLFLFIQALLLSWQLVYNGDHAINTFKLFSRGSISAKVITTTRRCNLFSNILVDCKFLRETYLEEEQCARLVQ